MWQSFGSTFLNIGGQALGGWGARNLLGKGWGWLGSLAGSFAGSWISSELGWTSNSDDGGPNVRDDLSVQTSTYGRAIPLVYGRYRLSGNVIWAKDYDYNKGDDKTHYYATFAVGLCEGPIERVRKIMAETTDGPKVIYAIAEDNEDSSYDATNNLGQLIVLSQEISHNLVDDIRIYTGTETQQPDPKIVEVEGGDVPAYRGLAYIVIDNLLLDDFGDTIPQLSIEVDTLDVDVSVQTISAKVPGVSASTTSLQHSNGVEWFGSASPSGSLPGPVEITLWAYDTNGNDLYSDTHLFKYIQKSDPLMGISIPQLADFEDYTFCRGYDGHDAEFVLTATTKSYKKIHSTVDWDENEVEFEEHRYIYRTSIRDLVPRKTIAKIDSSMDLPIPGAATPYSTFLPTDDDVWGLRILPFFPYQSGMFTQISLGTSGKWSTLVYDTIRKEVYGVYEVNNKYYLIVVKADGLNTIVMNEDCTETIGGYPISVYDGRIVSTYVRTFDNVDTQVYLSPHLVDEVKNNQHGFLSEDAILTENTGDDMTALKHWNSDFTGSAVIIEGSNSSEHVYPRQINKNHIYTSQEGLVGPKVGTHDITVAGIISDICARAGLPTDAFDTTNLTDEIAGYAITGEQTAQGALSPLLDTLHISVPEVDGQLKFIPLGNVPVEYIPSYDLINADSILTLTRSKETNTPKSLQFKYIDPANEYQTKTELVSRQLTSSTDHKTVESPVVMSSDKAAKKAESLLWRAILSRESASFALPIKYLYLTPGDTINVQDPADDNVTHTLRITETTLSIPGEIEVSAVLEEPSIYDSDNVGGSTPYLTHNPPTISGSTYITSLDIPMINPDDVESGQYIAPFGLLPSWSGGTVSQDLGYTWQTIGSVDSSVPQGNITTTLDGVKHPHMWDKVNQVTVSMTVGTLDSAADDDVMAGSNLALIGNEILAFANVVDNGDGTYTLSKFIRGLYGTEDLSKDSHSVNERFVLLDSNNLLRSKVSADQIGEEIHYRSSSAGNDTNYDHKASLYLGMSLAPLSPVHINSERQSNDDLVIKWVRQTRGNAHLRDYKDADLYEEDELYEIAIQDSNNNTLRTKSSDTTSVTYTSDEQIEDFGSIPDHVVVYVYQISSEVGRGNPGIHTIS